MQGVHKGYRKFFSISAVKMRNKPPENLVGKSGHSFNDFNVYFRYCNWFSPVKTDPSLLKPPITNGLTSIFTART